MILIVKHIEVEGPGVIADFFANTSWKIQTIDLSRDDVLPSELEGIEAIILLGGPMNVYEDIKYPFLKQEDIFLKKALMLKIPMLGICLGAQLIAKAAGARIGRALRPEIGWGRVLLTDMGENDPLFRGLGPILDIFQWHEDAFKIPPGGILLAHSDVCAQAIRLGENTYGLQFHIEVTPEMIQSWIDYYGVNSILFDPVTRENIVLDAYKKKNDFFKLSQKLLLNFSQTVAKRKLNKFI